MNKEQIIAVGMEFPFEHVLERYVDEQHLPMSVGKEHERELKRFLILQAITGKPYAMRGPIDDLWHTFVLFTKSYAVFCDKVAGRFIHHVPNPRTPSREKYSFKCDTKDAFKNVTEMREAYQNFLKDYEREFGETPSLHLWPRLVKEEPTSFTVLRCAGECISPCGCRCIA